MALSSGQRKQSCRGRLPRAAEPPRRDTHRGLPTPTSGAEIRPLAVRFQQSCDALRQPNQVRPAIAANGGAASLRAGLMVPGKRMQQGTRDVLIAREDEEIVCPKGTVCGRITRDANDNITDGDFALGRARLAAPAAAHAATVHARETASAHLRSFYTAMTER